MRHSQNITNKPTTNFLQAGSPSCRPTNSVKALKGSYCFELFVLFRMCVTSAKDVGFSLTIVCWFITRITQKLLYWFLQNLVEHGTRRKPLDFGG